MTYFILDIIIVLNTQIYKKGHLMKKRKHIWHFYMKNKMSNDIISGGNFKF